MAFASEALKKSFDQLKSGTFEDRKLTAFLERAIRDLKEDPLCGVRIPSRLWPKEYVKKFQLDNLRKYDLPDGWRLLYTIRGNEVEIISVLLEWFNHSNYERRFNY
ncbi:MAG TPA: type II toxin-antitoxin system RelE/ParE family toxin [archaeon]|nr:type II toxin-antitoxin system RelE/ParE family toxin [archaeon]